MPDREKVMRGLMHHSGEEIPIPCDNCPYDDEPYCSQRLAADALALLKEQEAMVMTRDEMIAAGKEEKAVFVEECPKGDPVRCFWGIAFPGMEPPKDAPFNYPGGVDFNVTDVEGDIWDGDFYNMNAPLGWRAWTSRPTEEQRKAVAWEPPKEESK